MIDYVLPLWNSLSECLGCNFNSTLIDLDGIILALVAIYAFLLKSKPVATSRTTRTTTTPSVKQEEKLNEVNQSNSKNLFSASIILIVGSVITALYSFLTTNGFVSSLIALNFLMAGLIIVIFDLTKDTSEPQ
jgi:uncharacterized ion transporter superfamily protein YfcC